MKRRLASLASVRILSSVIQGLMLLVLTAALGPVEFGQFATILVVCGILSSAFGFGAGTLALRLGGRAEARSTAGAIALLRYPSALMAGAITFVFGMVVLSISSLSLLLAATLMGLAEAAGLVVESILFGQLKPRRAQLSMMTRRTLLLTVVLLGVAVDQVYALVIVGALVLLLISALWLTGRVERPRNLGGVVKESLPFWGADILSKLQTFDVVLANMLLMPAPAGIYAAASRITSPLNILASSMMSIFTPAIASAEPERQFAMFKTSFRYMSVGGIVIAGLGPLVGHVLEVVLQDEYSGVYWPVVVLCIGTGIAALAQSLVSYLYAVDDAALVFRTRVWSLPISLALGLPLALWFGPVGMAAVLAISQSMQTIRFGWRVLAKEKRNKRSAQSEGDDESALETISVSRLRKEE
jgi:O-antigen/teichoic acid export membrane protein